MADIWFGDLNDYIIETPSKLEKEKVKNILDELYQEWIKRHPEIFRNFKPVIINDAGVIECDYPFLVGFDEDEYKLTFVSQGTSDYHINWGWQNYEKGNNKIIRSFTNDLLKRLGKESSLYFSFTVNADDGSYESISISICPDMKNDFPEVDLSTDFYEEADED